MAANPRLMALLERLEISIDYSEAAMEQAQALAKNPGIDEPTLVDRRELALCTIDEPESKDLDQALYVEALEDSGHRVWYAIADAAHFVRPGSALWREALARGSSYYMPGLVVPMLPRILSEGVVSLNPGEDRRALLFVIELDAQGQVRSRRLERARVHSRAKLSYQGVQAWYDGQGAANCDEQVQQSLKELAIMGKRRIALALERGVVPFRRREVDLQSTEGGERIVAYEDLRREIERYNEQVSLLCNVQGAHFLLDSEDETLRNTGAIHPIYRVHPAPAPERLAALRERIDAMLQCRGLDPKRWAWDGRVESFADWLSSLPQTGAQGRIAQVIHRQAVVSSGRAGFTSVPGAHHGIGAEVYGRFTAPMREIVGVYLHGEAQERLGGPISGPTEHSLAEQLRDEVIAAAERAANHQKALDREANRIVLDQIMRRDCEQGGQEREGTVMGMTRRKLHVRLQSPPLDIKVYLHHLEAQRGGRLYVDPTQVQLLDGKEPVLTLGDQVWIQAMGEDKDADRWIFHLCRAP